MKMFTLKYLYQSDRIGRWKWMFVDVLNGSRQIGPLAYLPANLAPHSLGPNLPLFGKLGPGKLGPGKLGPGILGPGKSVPDKLVPCISYICKIHTATIGGYKLVEFIYCYRIYSANNWGIYSGIRCIMPTIGGYMLIRRCLCALRAQGCGMCIL